MFRDRRHAGRQLAEELGGGYVGADHTIVLGIPRGGVIVAAEIARRLKLPLDVIIASKIGAPGNPEFAIGAVDPDGAVTQDVHAGYSLIELEHLGMAVHNKIHRRLSLYRGERPEPNIDHATVILVDDGIATGLTMMSAIDYVKRHGAKRILVAVPVISADAATKMREVVDELVAVEEPVLFYAVGQFYRHFEQTSDDEVLSALRAAGV